MCVSKCVTKVVERLKDESKGHESEWYRIWCWNFTNFRLHCTVRNVGHAIVLYGVLRVDEVMTKNQIFSK